MICKQRTRWCGTICLHHKFLCALSTWTYYSPFKLKSFAKSRIGEGPTSTPLASKNSVTHNIEGIRVSRIKHLCRRPLGLGDSAAVVFTIIWAPLYDFILYLSLNLKSHTNLQADHCKNLTLPAHTSIPIHIWIPWFHLSYADFYI